MQIQDVKEMYYLADIEHLPSIMEKGILSHNLAHGQDLVRNDFSMPTVQEIRARKIVPIKTQGGAQLRIHDYANLYFQPCNSTLFKICKETNPQGKRRNICILRIRPDVLNRQDAIISTANAACKEARFLRVKEGISHLNKEKLYSDSWHDRSASSEENEKNKKERCAELLIPHKLHPSYIGGIFVPNQEARQALLQAFEGTSPVPIDVVPEKFFSNVSQDEKGARKVSDLANSRFSRPLNFLPPTASVATSQKRKIVPVDPRQGTLSGFFTAKKPAAISALPSTPKAPTITLKRGNIFKSKAKTIVNTINCKGVMGAGIAKECKERFPLMFKHYAGLCKEQKVTLGEPYFYPMSVDQKDRAPRSIINFPTKDHWQNKADLEGIKTGLKHLVEHARTWKLESVAFPPLGCSNGRLEWKVVGPIMYKALKEAPFDVEMYVPENTPDEQMSPAFLG